MTRIRLEESADWPAIYAIYDAAFGQTAEADLVDGMRTRRRSDPLARGL